MPGSPNTHWLNSLFMKLFNMLLGNKAGCLRLHSVISFPFYAMGIYSVTALIKGRGVRTVFYCLALFNPFVLDFFSLARGYALALTFQVWTVYHLMAAIEQPFRQKQWMIIILLGAGSLGGNLSYLYTVLAVAGCFIFYSMCTDTLFSWLVNKQQRTVTLLFTALILLAMADLLFIKLHSTDMDITNTAFIQSVFESFWLGGLYLAPYSNIAPILAYGTFILLVVSVLYFTVKAVRSKHIDKGLIISMLVTIILALNVLFHLLFHTPFLEHRWAIQWYIPGLLAIFLAIDEVLPLRKPFVFMQYGLGIITAIAILFHWATRINTRLCYAWFYQAGNRQLFSDLRMLHAQHPLISSTVHVLYTNYYQTIDRSLPAATEVQEQPFVFGGRPATREELLQGDYLIPYSPVTLQWLHDNRIDYTIIKTYPFTRNRLVKLNH